MATKKTAATPTPKKTALKAPKKAWKVDTSGSGPLGVSDDGAVYAPIRTKAGVRFASFDAATGTSRWEVGSRSSLATRAPVVVLSELVVMREHAPLGTKQLHVHARGDGAALRVIPCSGSKDLDATSAHVFGPFRFGEIVVCVTLGPLAFALLQAGREDEPPPRGRITATSATTGDVQWSVELPSGVVPQHAFADGERLVVAGRKTADGTSESAQPWEACVMVFRGSDGSALWEDASGACAEGGGDGVVLADVRAARANESDDARGSQEPNELVAFDGETGAVRFRRAMNTGWTSLVHGDRVLVIEAGSDAAVCLDAASGAEIWSATTPHDAPSKMQGPPIPRSLAVVHGTAWFTGSRDRIIGYHLEDGRFQKSNIRGINLAADDERLFVGDVSSLTAYAFS